VDSLGKMNEGTNWTSICKGGSPGRYPSQPCPPLTGIKELSPTLFSLSPNPVSDIALLEADFLHYGITHIYIADVTGKTVREIPTPSSPSLSMEISTKGLASGLYFVNIEGKTGRSIIKLWKQ
jgi:hypothetical protein